MKEYNRGADCYEDIINLPHHVSTKHPQMPSADRAAQFAPFAALTGHEAAIRETARLTSERMEIDETVLAVLTLKLQEVLSRVSEHPVITVTYFQPDERKDGGEYLMKTGAVKKIDEYKRKMVFMDGTEIELEEIVGIEEVKGTQL